MKDRTQLIGLAHQNPVRFEGHERNVTAISTCPDGERTATGSEDKTIRIWKLEDGRELKKWVLEKTVRELVILRAFSRSQSHFMGNYILAE